LLALLVVAEFISVYILVLSLEFDPNIIQTNPALKLAGVVIKNLLSLIAIKIICNFRRSYVREGGRLYIALLLFVPAISIFISIIIFELARAYNTDSPVIMFAFLGLMYINAIVFTIFESITRYFDKEYKYQMIEKQLEMQINHYNKLAENREILSEVIHDFKNHLNCMYNLYKYNKGTELGKYIENLVNVSDTEKIVDTGNPVIDALLNDKSNIAKKHGISFKQMLNLPSNINVAYNDICAILGNSLDNAIEACRRIENKSLNREIELSMNYRDSYLIIVVTNTFDKPLLKEGKFFRSSKVSPGIHGLGMQSIERTVKKYNGNMVVKHDNSHFALEIVMSIA
jgi:two-component system sensor histidine kinase AgrC